MYCGRYTLSHTRVSGTPPNLCPPYIPIRRVAPYTNDSVLCPLWYAHLPQTFGHQHYPECQTLRPRLHLPLLHRHLRLLGRHRGNGDQAHTHIDPQCPMDNAHNWRLIFPRLVPLPYLGHTQWQCTL
jgi:hypothetical protein